MRYAIIANPASGKMSLVQKHSVLAEAAEILDTQVYGLDTTTSDDFIQCAQVLARRCEVLVAAGGDGTLSHIINAVDTAKTPIAFLPLGTGNAMGHALEYKGSLTDIAGRIRDGKIREYDLINCEDKARGFMLSVGIEGTIIRLRDQYLARGHRGLKTYLRAFIGAYFHKYKRADTEIMIDDTAFEVKDLISLMVVKEPYYGFGMKVVPGARFDDRLLNILLINSGMLGCAIGLATAFTIGNRIGEHKTGRQLTVRLERPLALQIDGNAAWDADTFTFTILPKALKIKC